MVVNFLARISTRAHFCLSRSFCFFCMKVRKKKKKKTKSADSMASNARPTMHKRRSSFSLTERKHDRRRAHIFPVNDHRDRQLFSNSLFLSR